MRARDRERLVRAFAAGKSVVDVAWQFRHWLRPDSALWLQVEAIIRDDLRDRRKGREGK